MDYEWKRPGKGSSRGDGKGASVEMKRKKMKYEL